jgi:hypothetical protein
LQLLDKVSQLSYLGCWLLLVRLFACLELHFVLITVDQSQLDRAKASAKYAILANLESQVYRNLLNISLLKKQYRTFL